MSTTGRSQCPCSVLWLSCAFCPLHVLASNSVLLRSLGRCGSELKSVVMDQPAAFITAVPGSGHLEKRCCSFSCMVHPAMPAPMAALCLLRQQRFPRGKGLQATNPTEGITMAVPEQHKCLSAKIKASQQTSTQAKPSQLLHHPFQT